VSGRVREAYVRPLDVRRGRVDMTHGSGGRASAQLIEELFVSALDNDWLRQGNDGARPGDVVVLSGTVGDHGTAIMSLRENLAFETTIESDTAALHRLVAAMLQASSRIHCMRDPTRGGLATTLNEIASQSGCGMLIRERDIPIRPQVSAACEFLGLDPLYVANEGKLIAIVAPDDAQALLAAMHAHPLGRDAAIIGEVVVDPMHFVQMETSFGGRRNVDWLTGEQLPRIC
jgi:hydrogenase expression/formation protein HypE